MCYKPRSHTHDVRRCFQSCQAHEVRRIHQIFIRIRPCWRWRGPYTYHGHETTSILLLCCPTGPPFADEARPICQTIDESGRRRINWKKLFVALDVAAPADYVDPDRSFLDHLPQPYRLIVSVLDAEVGEIPQRLCLIHHHRAPECQERNLNYPRPCFA